MDYEGCWKDKTRIDVYYYADGSKSILQYNNDVGANCKFYGCVYKRENFNFSGENVYLGAVNTTTYEMHTQSGEASHLDAWPEVEVPINYKAGYKSPKFKLEDNYG